MHHSKALWLIIFAVCLSNLFCAKLDKERQWDNPVDPSGTNYFPPEIVYIDKQVVNVWPIKSFDFSIPATDNENAIAEYFWSFDNGITWKSTGKVSHISASWDTSSTGPRKILAYVTDIHDLPSRIDTINVFVHRYEPTMTDISNAIISQSDTFKQVLTGIDTGDAPLKYYWDINLNGWDDSLIAKSAMCSFSRPEGGSVFVRWGVRDESTYFKDDTFMVYFNKKPFKPKVISPANDTIKKFTFYDYTQNKGSVHIQYTANDPDDNDSTLTAVFHYGIKGGNNFDSVTGSNQKISVENIKESIIYTYKLTVSDRSKNSEFSEGQFIVLAPPPKPEGMKYVKCRDTLFIMGQYPSGQDSTAFPVHQVTFSNNFWIDTTEITVKQFTDLLPVSSPAGSLRLPVTNITWFDAALFCNARSKLFRLDTVYKFTSITGTPGMQCKLVNVTADLKANGYRLPTEAEWEFACRGGTSTLFFWGNDNLNSHNYAWTIIPAEGKMREVALLKPNPLDIYDMAGNVWEWCHDWYGSYQKSASVDPTGASSGTERVLRGGSAASSYYFTQSGVRSKLRPETYNAFIGFRAVLPVP